MNYKIAGRLATQLAELMANGSNNSRLIFANALMDEAALHF